MAAVETPTRRASEQRALRIRYDAARRILDKEPGISVEERWDLLIAVIAPSDPLLGLDSSTSSATEQS